MRFSGLRFLTNLDSVNFCTNKEISMEMWKSEISMKCFLLVQKLTVEFGNRNPGKLEKRNPKSHVFGWL